MATTVAYGPQVWCKCISGHLSAALAACQELPQSCSQSRQLCRIVEQALTILQGIPATAPAAISAAAEATKHDNSSSRVSHEDVQIATNDQSAKQPSSPLANNAELMLQLQQLPQARQRQRQQQQQQQKHKGSSNNADSAISFPAHAEALQAPHGSIYMQLALLSSSSSHANQLVILNCLQQQASQELAAAAASEADTPVRSAICRSGGIDQLLHLITCQNSTDAAAAGATSSSMYGSTNLNSGSSSSGGGSSSSSATTMAADTNHDYLGKINSSSSSSSSPDNIASSSRVGQTEVAIAAGNLLLSVTDSSTGSHRSCNSWAHRYISTESVPALVQLLLYSDPLALRAAELLTNLAKGSGRHTEVAAAGGIAALLHILSTGSVSNVTSCVSNMSLPARISRPASVWRRPYALLAAAAAALEALIDGPEDVQIAIAQAGGIEVLENVCEYMVRQQMVGNRVGSENQKQQKLLEAAAKPQMTGRAGAIVRHTSASSMPWA